ncbi:helix-turn-helix domain-containing protein [Heliobacillus mobilis]|uniref:Helix-turn-helix domain-containing protein n=1 Tax=Heliobacterium mobile TaxID=28064 RepID=A0A6I3SM49_HELMO|nr:helix-turn-helix transcriptional regulator [Heliobacterium mobile]MTV50024.1 helix-turn-helix domain-containing protein [Heliobacterium mobile]
MAKRMTGREKAAYWQRVADTGDFLRDLRIKQGSTLAEVSENVGVSVNFLSEIERGLKAPSDNLIVELAKYYQIDINELYQRLGKIPESVTDELEKSPQFQKLLLEINSNPKLSKKRKQELYEEIYDTYLSFIEEMESEKMDGVTEE